ncbi:L,D-transpeptidase family protein [Streptomyces sp. NBC_00370]|uniref:L,D-transpeptidase family protein n=1 Tax=Streptomyces sp. NBC_00370 TaxID=2975728 RepID=UPI002E255337
MLSSPALCRVLAAAAVLAVTAGCSVDPAAGGPVRVDHKPGGGTPTSQGTSGTPSASAPAPSAPASTPAASKPAPSRSAQPAAPRPATVLASGDESGQVRELQARLRQIGHFDRNPTGYYGSVTAAAVSSFQHKRGLPRTGTTDTVTWQRLLAMTKQPTGDELRPPTVNPLPKPDPRCMTGRVMCINKTSRTLAWMIDGKVRSAMDVRFGAQYTPTREGVFSVFWKSRHHVSTLYDSPMPYAMFFSGGQAVHYSSDFAARGYAGASHGCVNVRDEGKIASLYAQVRKGDKVVVYK